MGDTGVNPKIFIECPGSKMYVEDLHYYKII